VSQLVAARGGVELMPELGYKPVNRYLPPRRGRALGATELAPAAADGDLHPVLRWIDRVLSR
jgi:hypothetical protein